ncbi:MAG: hypothetical protein KAJ12_09935, partial [Bacteroidetes bacterium]|nr:hypothetical protein [Bacteroidota bacterium]
MKTRMHAMGAAALLALVLLSLGAPERAVAQGESAVPFLLIAPTSRFGGVGETGGGWVDDNSAIFYNPGALAFLDGH